MWQTLPHPIWRLDIILFICRRRLRIYNVFVQIIADIRIHTQRFWGYDLTALYKSIIIIIINKKAQLSLTNPCDAKACQKLLQFDVLTTLLLTILAYFHAFSRCCVRNLRNPEKFTENSNLWSWRSSKVIHLGANRKPICDLLLVINNNFSRICYRFRDIHG